MPKKIYPYIVEILINVSDRFALVMTFG